MMNDNGSVPPGISGSISDFLDEIIPSGLAIASNLHPGEIVSRYPTTDEHAMRVVLNSFSGLSVNSQRSYRKEFTRFLLWLKTTREWQPDMLRRVTTEEIQEYARFLLNPRPISIDFLKKHGWTYSPFKKPLSESSRGYAIRLVTLMFSRLQNLESESELPYAKFNPAVHVAAEYKRRVAKTKRVRKAFEEHEWNAIVETIEELPRSSPKELAIYHRARWIFAFMYHTFSRIGDVASFQMNSFRRDADGWYINLIGKGNLDADIVATPQLMNELRLYRKSLSLPAFPAYEEDIPGVVAFRKRGGKAYSGLTVKSIYLLCKEIFHRASVRIDRDNPEAAARFRNATPHWLRHTSITHALEKGIQPRYVQAQARHSSLDITAKYDHSDRRAWRKDFEEKFKK